MELPEWKEKAKIGKNPTSGDGAHYLAVTYHQIFISAGVCDMSARKQKRNTKYVNSLLQGHLMWRMAMYWLIYNGALIGVIAGGKLMTFIPDMIAGKSSFSFGQYCSDFMGESRTLMIAMAVFCPLLIWDMLKFSHRIAGPLYRFRKTMEDHVNGEPLKPAKLRDGDLLGDFQGVFNEFVAYVNEQNPNLSDSPTEVTVSPTTEGGDLQPC